MHISFSFLVLSLAALVYAAPAWSAPLRVALITPSLCDDHSWSQSMCEGARAAAAELSATLTIRDGQPDTKAAAGLFRVFAEEGYDVIIAHGTQYQSDVESLAPRFPDTTFVFGTGDETRESNIFAYDPQPQEGAYLMGVAAGLLTRTNVLALISPTDVRDAIAFNRGFELGVKASNPVAVVGITYIGLFDDLDTSRTLALAHMETGADILSGSGQQAVGALQAARQTPGVFWMANDFDMRDQAPDTILAAQCYRYEGVVRDILTLRTQGVRGGRVFPLSLSRGNVSLEWSAQIAPDIRQHMLKLQEDIQTGGFKPDIRMLGSDFRDAGGAPRDAAQPGVR